MNHLDFLKKLGELYPSEEKAKIYQERMKLYANILEDKEKNAKLDYDKMLKKIIETHEFRNFPLLPEILKHICYLQPPPKPIVDENSRKFIVTIYGREYEFTEVPSTWEKVHSKSDFKDIREIT